MSQDSKAWHADEQSLRALADGRVGPVLAASLESHVMRCDTCRARVNEMAFTESLEESWTAIRESVEAPRPGVVERLLTRFGVSSESGRLLAAVPAMRGGWILGVVTALLFALVAAGLAADLGVTLFLLVAPLVPVAGVASAFGGDADPAQEIVVASPYSSGRLLMLRTAAVLATCAPLTALVGLGLPGPAWLAIAWLTPAAAGLAVTLALGQVMGVTRAAASAGVVWSAVTLTAARAHEPLALVGPLAQSVCLVLAVVSVALFLTKYDNLDLPGRAS